MIHQYENNYSDDQYESGASGIIQKQASHIKKGDYAILKGQPCKILEMTTSKAGKHGSSKAKFLGINIFTNKKVEDADTTTTFIDCPVISKTKYQLLNIREDLFLNLMCEKGKLKQDLKFPDGEEFSEENIDKMYNGLEKNKIIYITVISALGKEKIIDYHIKHK